MGEPGAQPLDAFQRHPSPHPGPARRPGQRPRHQFDGLEVVGRIAAGEVDRAGRRPGQQRRHVLGGDPAGAERDPLPGEVGGRRRLGRPRREEGAVAGPRLEHAFVGQPRHRLPHGDGADPVPGHQRPHRRQAAAGRQPAGLVTQRLNDGRYAATLSHEKHDNATLAPAEAFSPPSCCSTPPAAASATARPPASAGSPPTPPPSPRWPGSPVRCPSTAAPPTTSSISSTGSARRRRSLSPAAATSASSTAARSRSRWPRTGWPLPGTRTARCT